MAILFKTNHSRRFFIISVRFLPGNLTACGEVDIGIIRLGSTGIPFVIADQFKISVLLPERMDHVSSNMLIGNDQNAFCQPKLIQNEFRPLITIRISWHDSFLQTEYGLVSSILFTKQDFEFIGMVFVYGIRFYGNQISQTVFVHVAFYTEHCFVETLPTRLHLRQWTLETRSNKCHIIFSFHFLVLINSSVPNF